LVGVLYVLDEPSIGLHQRDNRRLIETLIRLRDLGNTVMVVEHDEETIRVSDYVVDIGPGAGEHGGAIVYEGPFKGLLKSKESITGQYLSGKRKIPVPEKRRPGSGEELVVRGAREHNLKNIDVAFPLGQFICITGVSGSGKSTLVNDILERALMQKIYKSKHPPGLHKSIAGIEYLDKVVNVDQSPIGRTPRSNPATYTGVFDHIRKLMAQTQESRVRGYLPGRFSFNVKGGRCEACAGDGTIKIEMHFLPDVYVPCEVCKGARYNRDTLDIAFRGKNIAEILDLSCEEACDFFANQPAISRHMQTLVDVGLGYVRLGQPAPTLSGGEAQRVKLATELAKRSTGHTIYLLDEPTTGLHFEDIRKLLVVLSRLVDQGNTVVVIEHNLDVIKTGRRQPGRHRRCGRHAGGSRGESRQSYRPLLGPTTRSGRSRFGVRASLEEGCVGTDDLRDASSRGAPVVLRRRDRHRLRARPHPLIPGELRTPQLVPVRMGDHLRRADGARGLRLGAARSPTNPPAGDHVGNCRARHRRARDLRSAAHHQRCALATLRGVRDRARDGAVDAVLHRPGSWWPAPC
jgi:energy-coupling factor transporter ATP-binding protein EcfA2